MLGWLLSSIAAAVTAEECEQQLAAPEVSPRAVNCFYDAARASGDYEGITLRVRALVARQPDSPWALYTLANLLGDQGLVEEAMPFYQAALEGFDRAGDTKGQVGARLTMVTYLAAAYRHQDCERLLDEAAALSEGSPELSARARAQRGRFRWRSGRDVGRAEGELRQLLDELGDQGEYQTTLVALDTLFAIAQDGGRKEAARWWLDRLVEHTSAAGDSYVGATVAAHRLRLETQENRPDREAIRALADDALRRGREGGNPFVEVEARCTLAWVEGWPAGREAWEACLAAADSDGDPDQGIGWRVAQVDLMDPLDPETAEVLGRAEALVADWAVDTWSPSIAAHRARLAAAAGRTEEEWLSTVLLMDRMSALAVTSDVQARAWVLATQATLLYEPAERMARSPESVDRALRAVETLRGVWLDGARLAERNLRPTPRQVELRAAIDAALDGLWDAEGDARAAALQSISGLRAELVLADREARGSEEPPSIPTFAELRAALGPDEALVSLQLPDGGGLGDRAPASWAWVVTPGGVERVALPSRADLEPRIRGLVDAMRARDGSERGPDASLAADLWAPVAAALPAEARSVLLVPDGPVHGLPVGALRGADGQTLDARHAISVLPSAVTFASLRRLTAPPPARSAAVVGPEGPGLVPLPAAAREADALARVIPGTARRGLEATEAALAEALQDPAVGWVHVAAHAEVDPVFPEQSRILLSPSQGSDGALTAAEIAALRIPGQVVVLSACATAEGRALEGEGPQGLARALLDAGARAVVATAWPLRDEDAASFFEAFYQALEAGQDVGGAVASARVAAAEAGAPAEAWAGVIVVGDPRWAPVPGGRSRLGLWTLGGVGLAGIALAAGAWFLRRGAARTSRGP